MVLDLVYCLTISSRTPAYLSSEVRANIGASRKEDVNHLPINFSNYYLFNNEAILKQSINPCHKTDVDLTNFTLS